MNRHNEKLFMEWTNEDLIKLARRNLEAFHNEADLAEYLAFLFSELAILDRDWERRIGADIAEMEG